jgi:deoxyribonuclease V
MSDWPASAEELTARQYELAALSPVRWTPAGGAVVAGCFVCFPRGKTGPGRRGDPGWAAAATPGATAVVTRGEAGAP